MGFVREYKSYIRVARKPTQFGSDLKIMAKLEPLLGWLYKNWWHVSFKGIERIPLQGPALIVGNTAGIIPWPGLMLSYALMARKSSPRRLNILCEMDWIEDKNVQEFAAKIGFVQWSKDNARALFSRGELVAIFPEGVQGAVKPYSERYRLREFDWTRILPALEENVKICPLATLGCDESFPIITNLDGVAKVLDIPAFPVTPFMPLLPFPFNMASFPGRWDMHVLRPADYGQLETRNERYETALTLSRQLEGEVQAEINRMLRTRVKAIF